MRIIGGKFRGRRLHAPRGQTIRPTADRIREAIFNILGDTCRGRPVIDLFAGTGALGLEALSRGADSAIFVDHQRVAVDAIRRNIEACGCESRARVFLCDIRRNLHCIRAAERPAEFVFMDPPYHLGLVSPALKHLHNGRFIATGSRVIIEHGLDDPLPAAEEIFQLADQRRYGKTLVSFFYYVL